MTVSLVAVGMAAASVEERRFLLMRMTFFGCSLAESCSSSLIPFASDELGLTLSFADEEDADGSSLL